MISVDLIMVLYEGPIMSRVDWIVFPYWQALNIIQHLQHKSWLGHDFTGTYKLI